MSARRGARLGRRQQKVEPREGLEHLTSNLELKRSITAALGPVVGGFVTQQWSWGWVFALNVTNLFDKEYFAPCRYFGDCFSGFGGCCK